MSRSPPVTFVAAAAALDALVTIVLGLWCWDNASLITAYLGRHSPDPVMGAGAVRAGAVALLALAELVLLFFVIGRVGRVDRLDRALRWGAAVVFTGAVGAAVAFIIVAR